MAALFGALLLDLSQAGLPFRPLSRKLLGWCYRTMIFIGLSGDPSFARCPDAAVPPDLRRPLAPPSVGRA